MMAMEHETMKTMTKTAASVIAIGECDGKETERGNDDERGGRR